jgi:hypothetical protein
MSNLEELIWQQWILGICEELYKQKELPDMNLIKARVFFAKTSHQS